MDKSIETIWKEGFLENDKLVAPKLNNLYNRKSEHIIEKFNRMFRMNLILIVLFSFTFLAYTIYDGIALLGISYFIIMISIAVVNKKMLNSLGEIDKNVSSYIYLKSFNEWMNKQLFINRRMAKFYYPAFFLLLVAWLGSYGKGFRNEILGSNHEIYFYNGLPVYWIISILIITGIIAFFGGKIYNFEVNLVYGRVFTKLDELIKDIEELRE